MASSSKLKSCYQIRSISLPCRSHPSTVRIEEEIKKLEKWEALSTPTAETIGDGLVGLNEMYKCVDELLNLPLTQKALSLHQHKRWIDESLDTSVRFLDVCGITRDFVSQVKEHVKDLQSSLRRRKGDSMIETSIAKYMRFRKEMKKDAKKLIGALKKLDNKIAASPLLDQLENNHISAVIRVLREVGVISLCVYNSLLLFLSVPISKPKSTSWSKLLDKGSRVACEDQEENGNELKRVDFALNNLCKIGGSSDGDKIRIAQSSLKSLEIRIERIENGLECLFRGLIRARASLLNIVSQ